MRDLKEKAINIGVGVGLAGALVAPAAIAEYLVWDSTQDAKQGVIQSDKNAVVAENRLASFVIELEPTCAQVVKAELADGIPREDALILKNQTLVNSGVCESDIIGLTTPLETASQLGLAVEEAQNYLAASERIAEKANDLGSHVGALVISYTCIGLGGAAVWYLTD